MLNKIRIAFSVDYFVTTLSILQNRFSLKQIDFLIPLDDLNGHESKQLFRLVGWLVSVFLGLTVYQPL